MAAHPADPAVPRTALVLTGGGARAAYQVGVLLAIAKLSPKRKQNPFPILCGTSAGAINATGLACLADDFGKVVLTGRANVVAGKDAPFEVKVRSAGA